MSADPSTPARLRLLLARHLPSSLAGEHLHQTLGDGSAGALAKARRLQAIKLIGP